MRTKRRTSRKSRTRRPANHLTPPVEEGARVAIPIFKGRVAPVLDTCTQLRVLDAGSRQVSLACACLNDRVQAFQRLGIQVVICGALSASLSNLLKENNIRLVCGIVGDVDAVVQAYLQGRLHLACFRMPGLPG